MIKIIINSIANTGVSKRCVDLLRDIGHLLIIVRLLWYLLLVFIDEAEKIKENVS